MFLFAYGVLLWEGNEISRRILQRCKKLKECLSMKFECMWENSVDKTAHGRQPATTSNSQRQPTVIEFTEIIHTVLEWQQPQFIYIEFVLKCVTDFYNMRWEKKNIARNRKCSGAAVFAENQIPNTSSIHIYICIAIYVQEMNGGGEANTEK